jgi:cytochrome c oxidase subunit I
MESTATQTKDKIYLLSWIKRWLFSTNHKDIGTLYLLFGLLMFFIGGIFALLIRAQLMQPGARLFSPELFNQFTTMHGLIMIFMFIVPVFSGFANWMIPLMIGAPDMAMPRINNFAFWLLPVATSILLSTLILPGSAPNFGWTMYAPLSTLFAPSSVDYLILTIHLAGISSLLGAINIIVTILNMRAAGMRLMQMPVFCWAWLVTAFLLIAVMPVLAATVTMMLMDRHLGTSFFNAAGGGDPLLYQHLFWFFGHPEVYIIILPAFGVISQVIPTFSRKLLFGYRFMVYAIGVIAFLSFIVWAHHMFVTGIPLGAQLFFMYASMLIAVPTGIKIFNWVATMYRGALSFETPMLFSIAFVVLFMVGGFSGIMLATVPANYQYQDSYFVVAHFHYVLFAGAVFSAFAASYYWLPKMTGVMYSEGLGRLHFWLTVIGMNLTFFPMHFLGLAGMPRRIADYALPFAEYNFIASLGAYLLGVAQLIFVWIVIQAIRGKGASVPARVWDGALGLEWTVSSPPPAHTFEEGKTYAELMRETPVK